MSHIEFWHLAAAQPQSMWCLMPLLSFPCFGPKVNPGAFCLLGHKGGIDEHNGPSQAKWEGASSSEPERGVRPGCSFVTQVMMGTPGCQELQLAQRHLITGPFFFLLQLPFFDLCTRCQQMIKTVKVTVYRSVTVPLCWCLQLGGHLPDTTHLLFSIDVYFFFFFFTQLLTSSQIVLYPSSAASCLAGWAGF